MNIYLLRLIINWLSTLCLSLLSLFGGVIHENTINVTNTMSNKNTTIVSDVVEYKTIKKYNKKLPSTKVNVIVEGKNGMNYLDSNGNSKELNSVVDEVLEIGTGLPGNYTGDTTGYGADCAGCSGNVSCKTREGTKFNLETDGIYYNDIQFGSVRVLAADLRIFGCGTIVEIDNGTEAPYLGIVMDTGSDMRNNWDKYKLVHIDIAFSSETDPEVYSVTSRSNSVKFNVQRWGW